jgi:uncharacterized protein (TIGR03546 family)
MFSFINIPARILTVLELNISPAEVAGGVCLAMFLGFIPLNGPMALLLFLFFFLFKINRFSTVITLPFFKLLYVAGVSVWADRLGGYLLLNADFLTGFWRYITNLPVLALLDLNNTLVAGGLALSMMLFVPVYILSRFTYVKFIENNLKKMQESKFVKRFAGNPFVKKLIKDMDKIRSRTE